MNKSRIDSLDGLRGIAAFLVFIHHFLVFFHPTSYNGNVLNQHDSWEMVWFKIPLNVLTNGNFFVCIFFVLSGYVLSIKHQNGINTQSLKKGFYSRYFRLFLPSAFFYILSFALFKTPFNTIAETHDNIKSIYPLFLPEEIPSIQNLIEQLSYKIMIYGEAPSLGVLWSISTEFLGSILLFVGLMFYPKKNKELYMGVLSLLVFFFFNVYFLGFLFGSALCLFQQQQSSDNKMILALLFVISLLLGAYPHFSPETTWYGTLGIHNIMTSELAHIIGATCLVYVMLNSELLKNFLSKGVFLYLGRISFCLYLFHHVAIYFFSNNIYALLEGQIESYFVISCLNFGLTSLVVLFISHWTTILVDDKSIDFSKRVSQLFIKQ